jgi:hypothetical protein
MRDLTKRPKRQPVAHDILDDRFIPIVVEAVGVLPEPVGNPHLFVNELGRWLPRYDAYLPAQRDPNNRSL